MSEQAGNIVIDLGPLQEIAGGDDSFVALLLMKMTTQLPVSFADIERTLAEKDWQGLKSAAHKAKGTFAYLGMDEIKNQLRDIEHDAYEEVHLDQLPEKVDAALVLGRAILAQLEVERQKLS